MEHAHARRPRADQDTDHERPPALHAVSLPYAEPLEREERTRPSPSDRPRRAAGREASRRSELEPPEWDRSGAGAGPGAALPSVGRRTVQVGSRPAPARRTGPSHSAGSSPDRLALWAVILSLFLALVAAATARGEEKPAAVDMPPPAVETRR